MKKTASLLIIGLLSLSIFVQAQSNKKKLYEVVINLAQTEFNCDYVSSFKEWESSQMKTKSSLPKEEAKTSTELKTVSATVPIPNFPLVFLDGVPVEYSLETLKEIKYKEGKYAIKPLKGTQATALYGSRASKGVILIHSEEYILKNR